MSGIGNYLHYTAGGYLHRGISKTGSDNEPNIYSIIQEQRQRNKARINRFLYEDAFIAKYQATLDSLFGGGRLEGGEITQRELAVIQESIQEYISNRYGNKVVNWATLGVDNGEGALEVEANRIRVRSNQHYVRKATIEGRMDAIEKALSSNQEELSKKTGLSQKELDEIVIKVQNLRNDINEVWAKEAEGLTPDQMMVWQTKLGSKGKKDEPTLIERINELISKLRVDTISLATGDALELSGAVAGLVAQGVAAKEIISMLKGLSSGGSLTNNGKNIWVGQDRANPVIMGANFDPEFVNLGNIKKTNWNFNGTDLTFNMGTQNKIDFYISADGVNLKGVSAKNINLGKSSHDIQLVGGTDLLSLIQNEDSDFINHYLNVTAAHYAFPGENEEERTYLISDIYRANMHQVMKEVIFINALTAENISKIGPNGNLVSSVPEYFLLNDNSKIGHIRVVSMRSIISKVLDDIERLCRISGYNNPLWINKWAESGPQERITNVVGELHKAKIYAYLKASAVNQP